MFRIWTERSIPTAIEPLFATGIRALGPGTATPEEPTSDLGEAEGVIAGGAARYDAAFMDQAPDLRVIARTGIGIDNVDLAAATERGIAVCNTPDGPTVSTAEHAITLMLNTAKGVKKYDKALRESEDRDFVSGYDGLEMQGLRLGLVGLGRIGSRVAAIASAIGMDVAAFDPFIDPATARSAGISIADSLEELLSTRDVISLHMPLTQETRHIMNSERFGLMKKGAIFINAARGGLVDESALLSALRCGHLRGAGLDVFDPEPPSADHPLLHRDDVIVTPHVAGVTVAGRERMWRMALAAVLEVLRGKVPESLCNPDVTPR